MAVELGVPGIGAGLRVGAGGFGTVYRAEQLGFGRAVAVKILHAVVEQDFELRRFERERQALGSVADHPNIVSVFGWGLTADRRPYLVMEYLPGGTLAGLVKHGPVSADVAVSVTAKLARALAVAHERGVLHRDVKPENVLISAFGEPVLCDFGIARPAQGATTHTSSVATSVLHAAPEVLEGAPPSEGGDIWALVSTLHTMLAGRPPFRGEAEHESMAAVISRVLTRPPPDLRASGVADDVAAVVEAGLVKDPGQRLGTAAALAERLEAVMAAHGWVHQLLPVTLTGLEPLPPAVAAAAMDVEPAPAPVEAMPAGTVHLKPTPSTPVGMEAALAAADRYAAEDSTGRPQEKNAHRPAFLALGVVAMTALMLAGLLFAMTRTGGNGAAAGEVFLEATDAGGTASFMPSVAQPPLPAATAPLKAEPVAIPGVQSSRGDAPGLYGGTQKRGSCDRKQMVSFLQQSPDKAKAWVSALNADPTLRWRGGERVGENQIGGYIGDLTPVLLRADTRVTNHGFLNGEPSPRQSALEQGTAVLVDQLGVPRVRCACGNPLTPARAVPSGPVYTGQHWPAFDPAVLRRIEPSANVISAFSLVDLETGEAFQRAKGTEGGSDTLVNPPGPTPPVVTAPPTTSPPPTPVPTSTSPSTAAPDPAAVKPGTDGLGVVTFGDEMDGVIAKLTSFLGKPDHVEAWTSSYCDTAPGIGGRLLIWGDLGVTFSDDPSAINGHAPRATRHFWGYQYGGGLLYQGGVEVKSTRRLGLKTPSGVGLGSTGAEIKQKYGTKVTFNAGDPTSFPGPSFSYVGSTAADTLTMDLDADDEQRGRIVSITAGGGCGE